MVTSLRGVSALLLGTLFLFMGSGLLHTLIALQGRQLGFTLTSIGALTSAYYLGFLIGTHLIPRLTHRIGHIRAFAFGTGITAIVVLMQAIVPSYWLWYAARVLQGMLLVGLYAIIESWLNRSADAQHRSFVFSVYMMINLGATAAAQQLLRIPGQSFVLFSVVAMLFCLAGLPILVTPQVEPRMQELPRVRIWTFFRRVPIAIASALISGLVLGALWGLLPLYVQARGYDDTQIGTFISLTVAGGVVLQWPLGHLADRIDRRLALILICSTMALTAAATMLLPQLDYPLALALAFLFGGSCFTLYPAAVAHLVDYLESEELLSATSTVLLVNGLGSALGPLLAGALMNRWGPDLLFGWFAGLGLLLAVYAGYRCLRQRLPVAPDDSFQPMAPSADKVLDLHPNTETRPIEDAPAPAAASPAAG